MPGIMHINVNKILTLSPKSVSVLVERKLRLIVEMVNTRCWDTQEGRLLGGSDSEAGRGQPEGRENGPLLPLPQNAWFTPLRKSYAISACQSSAHLGPTQCGRWAPRNFKDNWLSRGR